MSGGQKVNLTGQYLTGSKVFLTYASPSWTWTGAADSSSNTTLAFHTPTPPSNLASQLSFTATLYVDNNSYVSNKDKTYTFTNAPIVTSITPTQGAQGTSVQIQGFNFTGATQVMFGSLAATSYTVQSSTLINAAIAPVSCFPK